MSERWLIQVHSYARRKVTSPHIYPRVSVFICRISSSYYLAIQTYYLSLNKYLMMSIVNEYVRIEKKMERIANETQWEPGTEILNADNLFHLFSFNDVWFYYTSEFQGIFTIDLKVQYWSSFQTKRYLQYTGKRMCERERDKASKTVDCERWNNNFKERENWRKRRKNSSNYFGSS